VQGDLDPGRAAPPGEPRGDDPRVVEHQDIARSEQVRQVAERAVRELRADLEQARGVARPHRVLGDQLARQVEIEVVCAHGMVLDVGGGSPNI
jgi:hypothetical protein